MKKRTSIIITTLLAILIIFSLCLIRETKSSSVSDNISGGIILKSTARVKKTKCIGPNEFRLPASNPAALIDYGFGTVIEFGDETADYENAKINIDVPKDIDSTVQPKIKLKWACPTADPTGDVINVRWEITYIWLAVDATCDATSDSSVVGNYNVSSTAKGLVESDIQLTGFTSSDVQLNANIARRSDATPDTADSAVANLIGACLYYTSNKLGEPL